ncbi:MAG: ABC transporter permease [Candidatus Eremiobacteraeota bacterium]|nr:ABC transporter permease [Candidatus Eremiobacteraeota bacterium]
MIRSALVVASALLVAFIVMPLAGLAFHLTPVEFVRAVREPAALQALGLSVVTTLVALALTVALGTPLAYMLARYTFPGHLLLDAVVDLPIVVPPAVAGLALLLVFGRYGTLGAALARAGIRLSFTTAAVVMAQIFVASPFYVRAARSGFGAVDRTLEAASATLGMGPLRTFVFVTVPLAWPTLVGGAVLCWARALGEFGATIMFAGNLAGVSQTLPLSVYLNLEGGNIPVATALSVTMIAFSLATVLAVRTLERR